LSLFPSLWSDIPISIYYRVLVLDSNFKFELARLFGPTRGDQKKHPNPRIPNARSVLLLLLPPHIADDIYPSDMSSDPEIVNFDFVAIDDARHPTSA
jgi:hypothetical protein